MNVFGGLGTILNKKKVLVVGDSHATLFKNWRFSALFNAYQLNVVSVGGATISGLKNPNSKTQAMPIFNQAISSEYEFTICLLGEVDIGFLIWVYRDKYAKPVEEIIDTTFTAYVQFIEKIARQSKPVVVSIPLPTIKDGEKHGEVANLRSSVTVSQKQRTQVTLQFNQRLKAYCQQNQLIFMDLDADCLGADGLVKPYFLNKDKADHHYEWGKYAKLVHNKLIL